MAYRLCSWAQKRVVILGVVKKRVAAYRANAVRPARQVACNLRLPVPRQTGWHSEGSPHSDAAAPKRVDAGHGAGGRVDSDEKLAIVNY